MNNALFEDLEEQQVPTAQSYEHRIGAVTKILEVIRALNRDKKYIEFANLILLPALENSRQRLATEKDEDERVRLQGVVLTLQKFMNLEHLDRIYSNELHGLKTRASQTN